MVNNQLDKRTLAKLQRLYEKGYSGYGSAKNLAAASGLPLSTVKKFLHAKDSYTLYHNATRKFKRQKVYARYINDIWCMDLAFVDKLSKENRGIKYLLVCVDIFSRFVRVQPMKNKYASTTKEAFQKFLKSTQPIPNYIWVDQGTEFSGDFKKFCDQKGIRVYNTFSDTKAAFAERAIRSLKRIIYRYIEERGTYSYINDLQNFVDIMNSRINRSVGKPPKSITNMDAIRLHHTAPSSGGVKTKPPKFDVGDKVHISKYDIAFRKGYKPQYTREVFIINRVLSTKPVVTYEIKDTAGEVILGKFYEPELILTLPKQ